MKKIALVTIFAFALLTITTTISASAAYEDCTFTLDRNHTILVSCPSAIPAFTEALQYSINPRILQEELSPEALHFIQNLTADPAQKEVIFQKILSKIKEGNPNASAFIAESIAYLEEISAIVDPVPLTERNIAFISKEGRQVSCVTKPGQQDISKLLELEAGHILVEAISWIEPAPWEIYVINDTLELVATKEANVRLGGFTIKNAERRIHIKYAINEVKGPRAEKEVAWLETRHGTADISIPDLTIEDVRRGSFVIERETGQAGWQLSAFDIITGTDQELKLPAEEGQVKVITSVKPTSSLTYAKRLNSIVGKNIILNENKFLEDFAARFNDKGEITQIVLNENTKYIDTANLFSLSSPSELEIFFFPPYLALHENALFVLEDENTVEISVSADLSLERGKSLHFIKIGNFTSLELLKEGAFSPSSKNMILIYKPVPNEIHSLIINKNGSILQTIREIEEVEAKKNVTVLSPDETRAKLNEIAGKSKTDVERVKELRERIDKEMKLLTSFRNNLEERKARYEKEAGITGGIAALAADPDVAQWQKLIKDRENNIAQLEAQITAIIEENIQKHKNLIAALEEAEKEAPSEAKRNIQEQIKFVENNLALSTLELLVEGNRNEEAILLADQIYSRLGDQVLYFKGRALAQYGDINEANKVWNLIKENDIKALAETTSYEIWLGQLKDLASQYEQQLTRKNIDFISYDDLIWYDHLNVFQWAPRIFGKKSYSELKKEIKQNQIRDALMTLDGISRINKLSNKGKSLDEIQQIKAQDLMVYGYTKENAVRAWMAIQYALDNPDVQIAIKQYEGELTKGQLFGALIEKARRARTELIGYSTAMSYIAQASKIDKEKAAIFADDLGLTGWRAFRDKYGDAGIAIAGDPIILATTGLGASNIIRDVIVHFSAAKRAQLVARGLTEGEQAYGLVRKINPLLEEPKPARLKAPTFEKIKTALDEMSGPRIWDRTQFYKQGYITGYNKAYTQSLQYDDIEKFFPKELLYKIDPKTGAIEYNYEFIPEKGTAIIYFKEPNIEKVKALFAGKKFAGEYSNFVPFEKFKPGTPGSFSVVKAGGADLPHGPYNFVFVSQETAPTWGAPYVQPTPTLNPAKSLSAPNLASTFTATQSTIPAEISAAQLTAYQSLSALASTDPALATLPKLAQGAAVSILPAMTITKALDTAKAVEMMPNLGIAYQDPVTGTLVPATELGEIKTATPIIYDKTKITGAELQKATTDQLKAWEATDPKLKSLETIAEKPLPLGNLEAKLSELSHSLERPVPKTETKFIPNKFYNQAEVQKIFGADPLKLEGPTTGGVSGYAMDILDTNYNAWIRKTWGGERGEAAAKSEIFTRNMIEEMKKQGFFKTLDTPEAMAYSADFPGGKKWVLLNKKIEGKYISPFKDYSESFTLEERIDLAILKEALGLADINYQGFIHDPAGALYAFDFEHVGFASGPYLHEIEQGRVPYISATSYNSFEPFRDAINAVKLNKEKILTAVDKAAQRAGLRVEETTKIKKNIARNIDELDINIEGNLRLANDHFGLVPKTAIEKPLATGTGRFFKSAEDRTVPIRYGKRYEAIEDEFKALQKMHKVDPEHVAKPLELTPEGYWMEEVDGIPFREYSEAYGEISPALKEKISKTIQKLHSQGLAHGDLANNILITEQGKNFKIIDPVGFKPKFENLDKAIQDDLAVLDRLYGIRITKPTVEVARQYGHGPVHSDLVKPLEEMSTKTVFNVKPWDPEFLILRGYTVVGPDYSIMKSVFSDYKSYRDLGQLPHGKTLEEWDSWAFDPKEGIYYGTQRGITLDENELKELLSKLERTIGKEEVERLGWRGYKGLVVSQGDPATSLADHFTAGHEYLHRRDDLVLAREELPLMFEELTDMRRSLFYPAEALDEVIIPTRYISLETAKEINKIRELCNPNTEMARALELLKEEIRTNPRLKANLQKQFSWLTPAQLERELTISIDKFIEVEEQLRKLGPIFPNYIHTPERTEQFIIGQVKQAAPEQLRANLRELSIPEGTPIKEMIPAAASSGHNPFMLTRGTVSATELKLPFEYKIIEEPTVSLNVKKGLMEVKKGNNIVVWNKGIASDIASAFVRVPTGALWRVKGKGLKIIKEKALKTYTDEEVKQILKENPEIREGDIIKVGLYRKVKYDVRGGKTYERYARLDPEHPDPEHPERGIDYWHYNVGGTNVNGKELKEIHIIIMY